MDLNGKTVLLDGYNLEMQEGTGIRRYGQDVLAQVRAAGGRTAVLFSCDISDNPVLQEVALSDARRYMDLSSVQLLRRLPRIWRAAHFPVRVSEIRPGRFTQPPNGKQWFWQELDSCLSAPNCFVGAHQTWHLTGRPLKLKLPPGIDLMHMTAPLPIRVYGAPLVTTVHDLIPLRLPWATADHKAAFYDSLQYAVSNSQAIICVSEYTKHDLVELFDVPTDRVHVTYEPVPTTLPAVDEATVDQRLASYGLERGKYLLFVGAVDPKKNLKRLLEAFARLETDMKLVLVGPHPRASWDRDLRAGDQLLQQKRMIMPGFVPEADLSCFYSGAHAFVFPSLYEGFGLPPLEAMRFGCPVLTSNRTSLPEVCGDAAIYVDPFDTEDIAEKMGQLVNDASVRQRLVDALPTQLEKFSEEKYRERLMAAYEQAMGRG